MQHYLEITAESISKLRVLSELDHMVNLSGDRSVDCLNNGILLTLMEVMDSLGRLDEALSPLPNLNPKGNRDLRGKSGLGAKRAPGQA